MKFLIDEDVPVRLLRVLRSQGHDAIRVIPSSSDPEIADQAKREGRILITLDKDFTNTQLFPPDEFNIVRIAIHPPTKEVITDAAQNFLAAYPQGIKGIFILLREGNYRLL